MSDRAFSIRFGIYALAALSIATAVAATLAERNATARAYREAERSARATAAIVASQLRPGQLDGPIGAETEAGLDAAFRGVPELVRVWSTDDRVRWASRWTGLRASGVREAVAGAVAGRVTASRVTLVDGDDRRPALAAVAPLVVEDAVAGALELHLPWEPIGDEIRDDAIGRTLTVLAALVLLYAALFPILLRLLRGRRSVEAAARAQERLMGAIVEGASEGIWVLDDAGRISFANPRVGELLGLAPEAMVGRTIAELAAEPPRGGAREQLPLRRADGTAIWTLVSRHPLDGGGGAVVLVADIDELKGAERSLHEATRRLAAVAEVQREIAELELDPDAALARVVEGARELTGADGAVVYALDGDRLVPEVVAGSGAGLVPVPVAGSLAGTCFTSGSLVTSSDAQADGRAAANVDEEAHVRSVVLVPLEAEEARHTVLGVVYDRPDAFDDVAVQTVRLMAEFAAAALRNARVLQAKESLVVALAGSEERFRSAIDSSPIGFAICTPDDRYVTVNDAFCRIIGRERDELAAVTWEDITHPDDVRLDRELADRMIGGEFPHYQTEKRLLRPDGEAVWVRMSLSLVRNADGTPSYGVAQIQDVTEHRLLEQSLRDRSRLFRALFDQSPIAKLLVDDARTIVDANAAACALAGIARHQLLGRTLDDLGGGEDAFAAFWELLEVEGGVDGETLVVRADGTRRTVLFSARARVQPGLHLAVVQDVTEQRELEDRLRQGQKMEAVGRLAGGIAHDFNNMLTAIGGYAELLAASAGDPSTVCRHAEQIRGAADRAAALTRQLLAFSRRQVLQPAPLDLNEVVKRAQGLVTRLIGEHVRLETRLTRATEPVYADAGQLEQVIVNLAVNARDAMPRGGVLSIETDTVNVDPDQAREAVATPGRYARLTIADTGVGMDAEQLSRLFEPFYSTKGDAGVGLGLATVYGIVRQSGGFVDVSSAPGGGSTFRVYLPVTGLAPGRLDADERPPAGREADGDETVLLVEDEEVVRGIVAEMLEEHGYTVLPARDGAEAVRVAAAHDGRIDLIVTDVVMPGLSGEETAERIARERPGVRTLFVSGYAEAAVHKQGVLAPGSSFLEKPFSADELARKVRETLDGAVLA